jgi:hypothetical protein
MELTWQNWLREASLLTSAATRVLVEAPAKFSARIRKWRQHSKTSRSSRRKEALTSAPEGKTIRNSAAPAATAKTGCEVHFEIDASALINAS